jgi:hypothetical protein
MMTRSTAIVKKIKILSVHVHIYIVMHSLRD